MNENDQRTAYAYVCVEPIQMHSLSYHIAIRILFLFSVNKAKPTACARPRRGHRGIYPFDSFVEWNRHVTEPNWKELIFQVEFVLIKLINWTLVRLISI